uniref:Uncharacterized protein n=1 Tax=Tanacetum cinerariifolium TaxID=118510 RepID=A0A6L2JLA9_TANCI|nr:hypothetical protein [Tanacetum cinerariifolium]
MYPHLDNGTQEIVERVMRPLALRQTRRPRSDRGKACHSVSYSPFHHQGTSSHQHDGDDDDVETSRASIPSPTAYLNSLQPLDYQNYHIPSSSEQTDETLFTRQTTLPNQTRMIPEPGDPNHEVLVNETFHEQTDEELTEKELKQVEADDQDIQTILLGLPKDIYTAVDSYKTAQEIWFCV